jgi:hypothetical protein
VSETRFALFFLTMGHVTAIIEETIEKAVKEINAQFERVYSILSRGNGFEARMAELVARNVPPGHEPYDRDGLEELSVLGGNGMFPGLMTAHVLQNMLNSLGTFQVPFENWEIGRGDHQLMRGIAVVAMRKAMKTNSILALFVQSVIAAAERHGTNFTGERGEREDIKVECKLRDALLAEHLDDELARHWNF